MIYQQFGDITGWGHQTKAFLSIDEDRPDEFLISVLPEDSQPFAVLAFAQNLYARPIKLAPRRLLKPLPNGALVYPGLDRQQVHTLENSEILLNTKEDGSYFGTWKASDSSGSVVFQVPQHESEITPEVVRACSMSSQ